MCDIAIIVYNAKQKKKKNLNTCQIIFPYVYDVQPSLQFLSNWVVPVGRMAAPGPSARVWAPLLCPCSWHDHSQLGLGEMKTAKKNAKVDGGVVSTGNLKHLDHHLHHLAIGHIANLEFHVQSS